MTRYQHLLGTLPCFRGVRPRDLRIIARLIDVVAVPAGSRLSLTEHEAIVAVHGHATTELDGAMVAITELRVFVFGRRELRSFFDALPDLVLRPLASATLTRPSGSAMCAGRDPGHVVGRSV